jgi:hypothetical protein
MDSLLFKQFGTSQPVIILKFGYNFVQYMQILLQLGIIKLLFHGVTAMPNNTTVENVHPLFFCLSGRITLRAQIET